MAFRRKGTGEQVSADDPEVRKHPERFVASGRDYLDQLAAQKRRQRAEKKQRDERKK